MREERGQIAGDLTVSDKLDLWGNVSGDVIVVEGGKLYARGSILGNLIVQYGGRVHVYGQVHGDIHLFDNTKLIHSGRVAGDVINDGGRLFIEQKSQINGKVKTKSGKTEYEALPPALPPE